eukprot:365574-Chlamydomonas_euryale.AAC.23
MPCTQDTARWQLTRAKSRLRGKGAGKGGRDKGWKRERVLCLDDVACVEPGAVQGRRFASRGQAGTAALLTFLPLFPGLVGSEGMFH